MFSFLKFSTPSRVGIPVLAIGLLLLSSLGSAAVLKMDLSDMTERADRVFRGTVMSVEPGTISVGGGVMRTLTYEFEVSDYLKGQFDQTKGPIVVELTMLDTHRPAGSRGAMQRVSPLPKLPDFEIGQDYVLFVTAPSAVGLTSTVGVDQGAFKVTELAGSGTEQAANRMNNAGIHDGPMPYADLAEAVRDLARKEGGVK